MRIYIVTVLSILAVTLGWVLVQVVSRAYSSRHPELGPHREEGEGCCGGCAGACHRRDEP